MTPVNIVVEDDLSKVVISTMIKELRDDIYVDKCWPDLTRTLSSPGFGYIKTKLKAFNAASEFTPYIILTDLDKHECAPTLKKKWLDFTVNRNLLFRVAVKEIEAWLLADRDSFADFAGVSKDLIVQNVDSIDDPKLFLIDLFKRSKKAKKEIRHSIVPNSNSTAKIGPNYNSVLSSFVRNDWNLSSAIKNSDSLNRACKAIANFKPE